MISVSIFTSWFWLVSGGFSGCVTGGVVGWGLGWGLGWGADDAVPEEVPELPVEITRSLPSIVLATYPYVPDLFETIKSQ